MFKKVNLFRKHLVVALLYYFYQWLCHIHSPRICYSLRNQWHPIYSDVTYDRFSSFTTSFPLLGCCDEENNASYHT